MLLIALTTSIARGVESASLGQEGYLTSQQRRITAWKGGEMHARGHTGHTKVSIMEDSVQLGPRNTRNWNSSCRSSTKLSSINELPPGRPPADRPIHRVKRVPREAPSFIPRYRRPPQLEEYTDRQTDELVKKDKVQESASAFGRSVVLAE